VGYFDKVIAAIDKMIGVLQDEEAEDIKKRDQCKDEYTKIESAVKDLEWKIEKNVAKIDKLEALIKQREDEKVTTLEEIEQVKQEISDMEATRIEENQVFLQEKADDENAIELLQKAKEAILAYYEKNKIELGPIQGSVKGVLLQEPVFKISEDQAPDATFSHKGKRKNETKGVISIIQMIIEDLGGEIKTGQMSEEEAQLAFEKQLAAAKKLKADLETKVVNLNEMIANRKQEKTDEEALMKSNKGDLKEQKDYKKEIKPDCDWILNAFEERAEKRKAEMDGLVAAKEYLAGAEPPAMIQGQAKAPHFNDGAFPRIGFQGLSFLQRRQ